MSIRTLVPAVVLVSLTACDFRDDEPNDEGALAGGGCVDQVTVLGSLEEASSLGFSAAEMLAVAEGSHATPMVWSSGLSDGPVVVEFGPETGAGELAVGVAYKGGEVRFV